MTSAMMRGAPASEPEVSEFPGHATLVVRAKTTTAQPALGEAIMASLGPVYAHLKAAELGIPGHNVVRYDPYGPDGTVEIECGVLTPAPLPGEGGVRTSFLPAGRVALVTHIGPYDGIGRSLEALLAWMKDRGERPSGTSWEEYGDWDNDAARLRTDLYILLA